MSSQGQFKYVNKNQRNQYNQNQQHNSGNSPYGPPQQGTQHQQQQQPLQQSYGQNRNYNNRFNQNRNNQYNQNRNYHKRDFNQHQQQQTSTFYFKDSFLEDPWKDSLYPLGKELLVTYTPSNPTASTTTTTTTTTTSTYKDSNEIDLDL
ncbi:hypothetical protein DLAC_11032 [Tieghemostelium lacteum]|uniref:Uncharacterized protein n=1 Tax=Tieghemostelium lacteum TaxID=361077 RepID=A0A151Z3D5_TIELA|nr:hypothetical protein DLAC_11032 [Tieghemostelium lacteum]|eukprot:KYQ88334.1 hypothetical protein DLAC_11032 [Tieghemostelium lacteum]